MQIKDPWLVVFDLDGTLIDSSLDLCCAVNAALAHVGKSPLPQETISSFIGDGAGSLMRRALGMQVEEEQQPSADLQQQEHTFDTALAYFLQFYREHKLDNTRLYAGVLPALQAIRNHRPDLPMAVLTNKPVDPSREICDGLGISRFFFANYGGNSFRTKKPYPEGLLYIMEEAASLHHEKRTAPPLHSTGVILVGDSDIDVHTARRAGARSLGCRYGLTPRSLEAAGPDLICDTPSEWPGLLFRGPDQGTYS